MHGFILGVWPAVQVQTIHRAGHEEYLSPLILKTGVFKSESTLNSDAKPSSDCPNPEQAKAGLHYKTFFQLRNGYLYSLQGFR